MNIYLILNPILLSAPSSETKTAIFDSGFLITVAVIVFSTLLIAFISHIKKDKCIKNFRSDTVTIYMIDGRLMKGRLDVENTGCELIMDDPFDGTKQSYIIYKEEYPGIRFFVRFHADMDAKRKRERIRVERKTYHPNIFRRIGRGINTFFKIIRDSMMDIFKALSGVLKTTSPSYATSEKYVTNVTNEAVGSMDATYNPLLEKYIGNVVICSHVHNGKTFDVSGILKEYTGQFIELLNVKYEVEGTLIEAADMLLPRSANKVRNLGENVDKTFTLSVDFDLEKYKNKVKRSSHEKLQVSSKPKDN